MSPRLRFGLRTLPLPRAAGKHFFADDDALRRLARVFEWLAAEPGLAGATGGTGVGDAMGTPTSPVVWPVRRCACASARRRAAVVRRDLAT